jgi:hypothetical protein
VRTARAGLSPISNHEKHFTAEDAEERGGVMRAGDEIRALAVPLCAPLRPSAVNSATHT